MLLVGDALRQSNEFAFLHSEIQSALEDLLRESNSVLVAANANHISESVMLGFEHDNNLESEWLVPRAMVMLSNFDQMRGERRLQANLLFLVELLVRELMKATKAVVAKAVTRKVFDIDNITFEMLLNVFDLSSRNLENRQDGE